MLHTPNSQRAADLGRVSGRACNRGIIGLFSHERIRFLSDYNKEHSNKHYDLDPGLILNEICNQEACYDRILKKISVQFAYVCIKIIFCLS